MPKTPLRQAQKRHLSAKHIGRNMKAIAVFRYLVSSFHYCSTSCMTIRPSPGNLWNFLLKTAFFYLKNILTKIQF